MFQIFLNVSSLIFPATQFNGLAGSHRPIRKDVCNHPGTYATMPVTGRLEIKICVVLTNLCLCQVWIKMNKSPDGSFFKVVNDVNQLLDVNIR